LGSFFTPRLNLRYQPFDKSVFRFSIGSGRKASNIFSENQEIFSTGRTINLVNRNGNFYGLNPEKALNYGLSFRQGFNLNNQDGDITIDYYVTDFDNQIVVDWENQGELSFYNLDGKSYAKSFQIEVDYSVSNNINFKSAFKNYNVKKQYNSGFKQNPLTPKNRFFMNIDFFSPKNDKGQQWKFDFTFNRVGKQRLPIHADQSLYMGWSPSYTLLNTQLTRVFSEKFEIYLGGENIGNYTQNNPILDSDNPFGTNFDSTLIFAPIIAPMLYIGVRLKL
jgi:outer membrane receptor for ferrienterochelin and colicin